MALYVANEPLNPSKAQIHLMHFWGNLMIGNAIRTIVLGCFAITVLAACGNTSPESSAAADATSPNPVAHASKLDAFASNDICNILPADTLKSLFSPQAEVKTSARVHKGRASCNYSWPRPDAEARKQAMIKAIVDGAKQGSKAPSLSSAAFALNYSISVAVKDSKASPASFVPPKLTEVQLQARIDAADKMVQKRLTDKQKDAMRSAGMENMAGRMLRAANDREVVNGIGDAAYWSPLGKGSLHVLSGQKALTISPSIADDKAGNLEVAKKICGVILG